METIRQRMVVLLRGEEMSARELSQVLGVREKEVYEHLAHIARSVTTKGERLIMRPSVCLVCGYIFQDRSRFTRPGRCPRCKKSRIQEPRYIVC